MATESNKRFSGDHHLHRALKAANKVGKPLAFIVAGHNGSGKSTLWYERLAGRLQIPLVNADRLTASILPPAELKTGKLVQWASDLRNKDERWQRLSQQGVQAFVGLIMAQRMPFAFETVFSHWHERPDGTVESKAEIIGTMKAAGYFVVLIFVGLTHPSLSILRVQTRTQQGGHDVPIRKLRERFPRTQKAIRHAAPLADMTLMFDNSRGFKQAFTFVRAQRGKQLMYDCRQDAGAKRLSHVAALWLNNVAPLNAAPLAPSLKRKHK